MRTFIISHIGLAIFPRRVQIDDEGFEYDENNRRIRHHSHLNLLRRGAKQFTVGSKITTCGKTYERIA